MPDSMSTNSLIAVVAADHATLREKLANLVSGAPDLAKRDAFLDAWVEYNGRVGLILMDAARTTLEDGDAIVRSLRDARPAFEGAFAALENAGHHELQAVARDTAPAFDAELMRVMQELVEKITKLLDDDDVVALAKRYDAKRSD